MTEAKNITLTTELEEATEALAGNLLHAEAILRFHEASDRLLADTEASHLLAFLSTAQSELRGRQAANQVSQADVDKIRSLQQAARANATIMAFAQAQNVANEYLTEINQEISQLLGFDFAALGGSGCC